MEKNIGTYQRLARLFIGVLFLWIGTYGIVHPLGRVFVLVLGVWFIAESALGICPLFYLFGVNTVKKRLAKADLLLIFTAGVQAVIGFEWWRAAFGKLTNDFASNFPIIVQFYAGDKNPFPRVSALLGDFVVPNAGVFTQLVQWGQVALAVGLFIGAGLAFLPKLKLRRAGYVLSTVALVFGVFMNAVFWLSAGWTGAGTAELNVVMFWVQLLLIYVWLELWLRKPSDQDTGPVKEVSGQFIYERQEIYEISE